MEAQLKELIDKIKSEGVAEAEQQASRIVEKARQKAERIAADAEKEAERITAGAKAKAEKFEKTGRETMTQAARNVILGLRSSVLELFDTIIAREMKSALSDKHLQDIIYELIKAWKKEGVDDIEVLLSPHDIKKLEKGTFDKLSREMKKGVEFRPLPEIEAGFRIGEKNGSAHYDFTDAGLAEYLSQFLNPKLSECVKNAVEHTQTTEPPSGKSRKRKGKGH